MTTHLPDRGRDSEGGVKPLDNDLPSGLALEKTLAEAEEQRRVFLELSLKYDRLLGELTMSRSWRVVGFLSAVWAALPPFPQRAILQIGRRIWPFLAKFRSSDPRRPHESKSCARSFISS